MKEQFPALIISNLALFPNEEIKIELSNIASKKVIDYANIYTKNELILISPASSQEIRPNIEDLPKVGIFCKIQNNIKLPNGNYRVTIRGINRIGISTYIMNDKIELIALTTRITYPIFDSQKENTYIKKIKELLSTYVKQNSKVSNDIISLTQGVTSLSKLSDIISAWMDIPYEKKRNLFLEVDYYKRGYMLISILDNEIKSLELDNKLNEEIRSDFEKSEKDLFIREKINKLRSELEDDEIKNEDAGAFLSAINSMKVSKSTKDNLLRELKRFETTIESSQEYSILRSHLEFVTSLPWNTSSPEHTDINKINRHLNKMHYGLTLAKDRIIEYMLLKKKNPRLQTPILCLIGPPGTGKTTFARELSKAIGRKFIKISVGGLNDSAELVGHRRTYIGAAPGKIMENIRKCGVNNPVILIDEVDKMVKDYRGDPASALLDILDEHQNKEFIDNYVGEPFDLSKVLFILTANDESSIPKPLLDRLEVIDINSYTVFDKVEIVKHYTMPRLRAEYGFNHNLIKLTDKALIKIINDYTKEAGMRDLERKIASIVRKILISGKNDQVVITEKDLVKYLGKDKYATYANVYDKCGIVNVPASTKSGGVLLNIESSLYKGREKIISTGSLGEVMKESISVSLSYIKSNSKMLKLDAKKLEKHTVHVHAIDGASKKDGPSAGLAITVSLISYLLDKKVPNDIAFTGEITLTGRILKVGGIQEKLICCYNSNIKKIYIPMENMNDLIQLPNKVLKEINIVPVNTFTEVYRDLFD